MNKDNTLSGFSSLAELSAFSGKWNAISDKIYELFKSGVEFIDESDEFEDLEDAVFVGEMDSVLHWHIHGSKLFVEVTYWQYGDFFGRPDKPYSKTEWSCPAKYLFMSKKDYMAEEKQRKRELKAAQRAKEKEDKRKKDYKQFLKLKKQFEPEISNE